MTFSEEFNMKCLIDHIALNVEDEEKMITFYLKLLLFTTGVSVAG
jgi:catechol 2,3-dioxygenase-like lactoylglutathione lyase family enzyme